MGMKFMTDIFIGVWVRFVWLKCIKCKDMLQPDQLHLYTDNDTYYEICLLISLIFIIDVKMVIVKLQNVILVVEAYNH